MVSPLSPNPRETDTRRMLFPRGVDDDIKPIRAIKKDELPPTLGQRTRSMTMVMSALGLATFVVPLVTTSVPVLGRTQWSTLTVLEGLIDGSLPAGVYLSAHDFHALYKLIFLDSFLFGTMFIYAALAIILVSALRTGTRLVIGFAAALAALAALLEMRGYPDFQLSLFGQTPQAMGGIHVAGFTWCLVLLVVSGLILAIATIKELEGIT